MPKLTPEDNALLTDVKNNQITLSILETLLALWKRNHSSVTTLFNISRWGIDNHMNKTISRLKTVIEDLKPQVVSPEAALNEEQINTLFREVIQFHDSSTEATAKVKKSTTSQIIIALCQHPTIQRLFFAPNDVCRLAPQNEEQLAKLLNGNTLTRTTLKKLESFLTLSRQVLQKKYLHEIIPREIPHPDYQTFYEQIIKRDPFHLPLSQGTFEEILNFFMNHSCPMYKQVAQQLKTTNNYEIPGVPIAIEEVIDKKHVDKNDVPAPIEGFDDLESMSNDELFLDSLKGALLTYGQLKQCLAIARKTVCDDSLLLKLSDKLVGLGDDEQVNYAFKDEIHLLKYLLDQQHQKHPFEKKVIDAIYSSETMRSCVTITPDSSLEELNFILDEMQKNSPTIGASSNIYAFRFIINNQEKLLNDNKEAFMLSDTLVHSNSIKRKVPLIHFDYGCTRKQVCKNLYALCLDVMSVYQKAKEQDKEEIFYDMINITSTPCFEGRIKWCNVMEWGQLLSDNRWIKSVEHLPSLNTIFAEFNRHMNKLYGIHYIATNHVYILVGNFLDYMEIANCYKGLPRETIGQCKQDDESAPEGLLTEAVIEHYLVNIFAARYPTLEELIKPKLPAIKEKIGLDHINKDSLEAVVNILNECLKGKLFDSDDGNTENVSAEAIKDYLENYCIKPDAQPSLIF